MTPNFLLEDVFLTKLHLDFVTPTGSAADTSQIRSSFNYKIGIHNEDKSKYRLTFNVKAQELDNKDTPIGVSLDAEIVGLFMFEPGKAKDEMDLLIRVNGTSVLYGILRGFVVSSSGAFPGGKLLLPTIMPQKIVSMVEKDRPANKALAKKQKGKGKGKKAPPANPST